MGQIERYVFHITHITHFRYTSTGPLLCFSSAFWPRPWRPTTRTNQGMTHPRNHTPHAHTRTHTATTPRTTPARHPDQHEAPHSTHTHSSAKEIGTPGPTSRRGEQAPTTTTSGPQRGLAGNHADGPRPGVARDQPRHRAANPSQEWRSPATKPLSQEWQGTNHHHKTAEGSHEWRGTAPRSLGQEWRGTHTTQQPHQHTNHTNTHTSRKPQSKEAGTTNHGPPAHHTHATTHTSARGRHTNAAPPHHSTDNADTTNTQHTTQYGHRAQPHTPQTHTTRDTPTHKTPHRNRQAPARSGGEPHTTTAG